MNKATGEIQKRSKQLASPKTVLPFVVVVGNNLQPEQVISWQHAVCYLCSLGEEKKSLKPAHSAWEGVTAMLLNTYISFAANVSFSFTVFYLILSLQ